MYPVDLPDVSDSEVTAASERYVAALKSERHGEQPLASGDACEVPISASNVRRLQLFDDGEPACWVPALHLPEDPARVLAVRLQGRWWSLEDVLRTGVESRSGLLSVRSIAERLVVFLLSQVVERPPEGAPLFALHRRTENCKVLWVDGRAVGFYTTKHRGSLCDGWSSCCYLLTVLDTVLVRRSSRRRGLGLLMLEDFCASFPAEDFLGVSSPISASMAAVLRKFLQQHAEHRERLYEVEAPGGWAERRNIWLGLRLGRYSLGVTSGGDTKKEAHRSPLQSRAPRVTPPGPHRPNTPPQCDELHAVPSLNPDRPPLCARPCPEEPQEVQRRAKRTRRTRVKP